MFEAADGDALADKRAGEGRTGELRALIGVEDVRLAVTSQNLCQLQNVASIVIDSRHASARRLKQSSTTAKKTNPRAIGM
jgi:hypothetical protein